ncbi:S8 family peptidase [Dyella mobilis]|uniref:S8 family serine peptidase n=1 Tax=Dyella mobilis TaxID=1849582 RepID=A0ABS2KM57_9GAMM|nr:S8 family peptidase [Dyella mobilis]MBM7132247.1 S8 family serine peptidase [Dyella mobilis]GLQ95767.1 protease [Dyella mobilis]
MKSFHSIRIGAMAAAIALVSAAIHAADAPTLPAPKLSMSKLFPVARANQTYSRFIITYRDGSSERSNSAAAVQNVNSAIGRAGLNRATTSSTGTALVPLTATYQRKVFNGADVVRTSRKLNQAQASALMLQIAADPNVLAVQPDYRLQAVRDIKAPASLQEKANAAVQRAGTQTYTPDDPYYQQYQWDYWNLVGGANTNNAWDLADGSGVTVVVLDTGITEHPDLDTSLADEGYDFITDSFLSGRDSDGRVPGGWDTGDWTTTEPWLSECTDASNPPEDSSWHGTHVSGTVAELTDNGVGMAGTAYKAKVLPVRVLGHCGGDTSDIADAIVWASGGHVDGVPDNTHPARVINMSLGGGGTCDAVTAAAINSAISRGTTVVVAAGNSGADAANFTPSSCPGVITVASNGITEKRAFYSNYGQTVTLSAPGGGIYPNDGSSGTPVNDGFVWSALNDGATTPTTADYGGYAGTSQATPHVAGTVALMLSAAQAAGLTEPTPAQIKQMLVDSARPFPVSEDHPIGAGIVDAAAAVNAALGNDGGTTPPPTSIVLTNGMIVPDQSTNDGASILYSINVPSGATTLNIRSMGGSGDLTLYVKAGAVPNADGGNADFTSSKPGSNQAVVIPKPQATTYYVLLSGKNSIGFDQVSMLAAYNAP